MPVWNVLVAAPVLALPVAYVVGSLSSEAGTTPPRAPIVLDGPAPAEQEPGDPVPSPTDRPGTTRSSAPSSPRPGEQEPRTPTECDDDEADDDDGVIVVHPCPEDLGETDEDGEGGAGSASGDDGADDDEGDDADDD
jgi:hypothetical protein